MKIAIKVLNEKHNRVTQELLFAHGYKWNDESCEVMELDNEKNNFEFTSNCYIELDYLNKNRLTYCGIDRNKNRFADTFLRLKELKEYLTNN